ncbi:Hypothetical protein LUCI_3112 [Lucifera butyrica]|uniref:Uncharacterized protein n=1 Tax=Lucifera butyrica TaxID=1351585 RepID=A0A498RA77_9FIRM|nr:hypothetical protein [Lucifera butyrica]VBB07847.1 Hypothetical protein LUCI_3112 [Lucifera butyrica]
MEKQPVSPEMQQHGEEAVVAAIIAALAAQGYNQSQISLIRRLDQSPIWSQTARMEGIHARSSRYS